MRRDLDALIDEARRAEGPTASARASAREALARRIARGDQVELEPELPEVATGGGLRAPGLARAGWALLGAAAVAAAALLVGRSSPSSSGPVMESGPAVESPPAAPSWPRAESEPLRVVSEPPAGPALVQPEPPAGPAPAQPEPPAAGAALAQSEPPAGPALVQPEPPAAGAAAADRVLQPLPEPPSSPPPSRAARRSASPSIVEPPRAAAASSGVSSSSRALEPEAGELVANNLTAESRALAEVQRALRDGEHDRALRLLGEHDQRFARGVLLEERAAARAIASCAAGLRDAARDTARTFASRYPNSPLRARVRASCEHLERERSEQGP